MPNSPSPALMTHSRQRQRSNYVALLPLDEPTGGLALTRHADGPGIRLANVVRISVVEIRGDKVVLLIEAPRDMPIAREELLLRKHKCHDEDNVQCATPKPSLSTPS
jgi:sRNA-binding carbon storage regulator CsrA